MKSRIRRRCVFVDIETGGSDPSRHPIIEIAAIAVEPGTWREIDSIELKVKLSVKDADPFSLGLNKYSVDTWERFAFPEHVAAEKFAMFCRRHATVHRVERRSKTRYRVAQLAGHNADRFDGPFLRTWYRRQKFFFRADARVLDTMQLAMWFFEQHHELMPPKNYKLKTLCEYFAITTPDHTALNDIRATVALTQKVAAYRGLPGASAAA